METILITNNPAIAADAQQAGVTRIMVDLENTGKKERQASRNTFISEHKKEDISVVRRVITKCPLIVRVNAWHDGAPEEIEYSIGNGADIIMLPMIRSMSDFYGFTHAVAGKAEPLPLIETVYSMKNLEEIAVNPAIRELYIGLNDLHLELGLSFLFEPLASGIVDKMVHSIKAAGKSFGFGGIAAIGSGELPAERILAEHARLGSSRIILSSRFGKDVEITKDEGRVERLHTALGKLNEAYTRLSQRDRQQQELDKEMTADMINVIADRLKKQAG
jgi:citrate lyase beta subunit